MSLCFNPERATLSYCAIAIAFTLLSSTPSLAGTITSTWGTQNGNWSDPTKWDSAAVPNNNGDTYDVVINNNTVTV